MNSEAATRPNEEPKYSKKRIQNAGKALRKNTYTEEDLAVLTNWRASHAYPLKQIADQLKTVSKVVDDEAVVAQRLKRTPSITNKLLLQPSMSLANMQDIGGCRVILNSLNNVYHVSEKLIAQLGDLELVRTDDYIQFPKDTGYRGIHQVYKYNSFGESPGHDGLFIEVQLRTKRQHYWATAVETLGAYLKQSLKSSQGDTVSLKFFRYFGDLMAIDNDQVKLHTNIGTESLCIRLITLWDFLQLPHKLLAYSSATKRIFEEIDGGEGSYDYYLVMTDMNEHEVSIIPFQSSELPEVNQKYSKLEQSYKNDLNKDVVLVSVKSITDLKQAYPSYFNDAQEFITLFVDLIEKYLFQKLKSSINGPRNQRQLRRHLLILKKQQKEFRRACNITSRRIRQLNKKLRFAKAQKTKDMFLAAIEKLTEANILACKGAAKVKEKIQSTQSQIHLAKPSYLR